MFDLCPKNGADYWGGSASAGCLTCLIGPAPLVATYPSLHIFHVFFATMFVHFPPISCVIRLAPAFVLLIFCCTRPATSDFSPASRPHLTRRLLFSSVSRCRRLLCLISPSACLPLATRPPVHTVPHLNDSFFTGLLPGPNVAAAVKTSSRPVTNWRAFSLASTYCPVN